MSAVDRGYRRSWPRLSHSLDPSGTFRLLQSGQPRPMKRTHSLSSTARRMSGARWYGFLPRPATSELGKLDPLTDGPHPGIHASGEMPNRAKMPGQRAGPSR